MSSYFEMQGVTKKFDRKVALDDVTLRVTDPSIVGLVGKNGSGKTTLLRHIAGLQLPTSGQCTTLGTPTAALDTPQLSQIGMAHQHDQLLGWMTVFDLIRYVADFYDSWDVGLERHLTEALEIDVRSRVLTSSPGNRQKVSLLLAVCHHPRLLLLDEPLSDLDPIVRRSVVETLLERFRGDDVAIIISSHLLHDLERVADRIVCLDRGKIIADASLDDMKEQYGVNLEQVFRQLVGAGV